jgi:hypothetical protein
MLRILLFIAYYVIAFLGGMDLVNKFSITEMDLWLILSVCTINMFFMGIFISANFPESKQLVNLPNTNKKLLKLIFSAIFNNAYLLIPNLVLLGICQSIFYVLGNIFQLTIFSLLFFIIFVIFAINFWIAQTEWKIRYYQTTFSYRIYRPVLILISLILTISFHPLAFYSLLFLLLFLIYKERYLLIKLNKYYAFEISNKVKNKKIRARVVLSKKYQLAEKELRLFQRIKRISGVFSLIVIILIIILIVSLFYNIKTDLLQLYTIMFSMIMLGEYLEHFWVWDFGAKGLLFSMPEGKKKWFIQKNVSLIPLLLPIILYFSIFNILEASMLTVSVLIIYFISRHLSINDKSKLDLNAAFFDLKRTTLRTGSTTLCILFPLFYLREYLNVTILLIILQ